MGESFFMPYLYMPSANANYVKVVSPWGNVHINKGFLEQLAVSASVIVLTIMLWRCAARLNRTLKKKTDAIDKDDGTKENESEEDGDNDDDSKPTLDEDLIKKGANSYYYTHQVKEKGTRKTMVSSYGWSDSKKTVSIYLTDNVVKGMEESQLILKWTNTSLSLDLLNAVGGYKAKSLVIMSLFHEITDVTWTAEKETLTITLTKAQELPWNSLNGAAKNMEDHIEYDDALYD